MKISTRNPFKALKQTLWASAVLAAVPAADAQLNLLVNGSFEQPSLTTNWAFTGTFAVPGWSGVSTGNGGNAGVTVGPSFGLAPLDGNQMFGFNGNNPPAGTYLEQAFTTTPGLPYAVTFSIGRDGSAPTQILQVQAQVFDQGGAELMSLLATPPTQDGWDTIGFNFNARSGSTRLRFTDVSGSNPNTDLFLDAVSVVEVSPVLSIHFSQVELCWDTFTNRWYQLQYASAASGNQWFPLATNWVAGTGSPYCTYDVIALGQPQKFYRLAVTNLPP